MKIPASKQVAARDLSKSIRSARFGFHVLRHPGKVCRADGSVMGLLKRVPRLWLPTMWPNAVRQCAAANEPHAAAIRSVDWGL